MASEMEKLRRENAELKSHLQDIRISGSKSSLTTMVPNDQNPFCESKRPVRESIDLRLSEVLKDEDNVVIKMHDIESVVKKPRLESSPVLIHDEGDRVESKS